MLSQSPLHDSTWMPSFASVQIDHSLLILFMSASSCVFGVGCRQNGHILRRFFSNSTSFASEQPSQITLLQHVCTMDFSYSSGGGKKYRMLLRWFVLLTDLMSRCSHYSSSLNLGLHSASSSNTSISNAPTYHIVLFMQVTYNFLYRKWVATEVMYIVC
mmetsp:Transcript_26545/g.38870  ORF Transcript_26545/g.38870 Transcript_26545/m.38870 type:complete len:159 (+) Transcript_26545:270-746(+)